MPFHSSVAYEHLYDKKSQSNAEEIHILFVELLEYDGAELLVIHLPDLVHNRIEPEFAVPSPDIRAVAGSRHLLQRILVKARDDDIPVPVLEEFPVQRHGLAFLGADPDMFAYWSSTQISPTGLNLANYNSRRADIALANGRTNTNATAREARYVAFVNQWLNDNPAIALYQPSLFYAMDQNVQALQNGDSLIDAGNRFQNVSNWTVNTAPVMQTP